MINIRFKQNYILTTIYTTSVDGKMIAERKTYHVKKGEIYPADQISEHSGLLTIFFGDKIIKGVATNLDKGLVEAFSQEIIGAQKATLTGKPGCGGCGKKK